MKRRVYGNRESLEGERINSLLVGAPASVQPTLKYQVSCAICGGHATLSHEELRRPCVKCPSSLCGTDRVREQLADTPAKARAREAAAERRKQREHDEALERTKIEAEQQLLDTHRKLLKVARENLASLPDDRLFVSESVKRASMTPDEASAYNAAEVQRFNRICPECGAKYRNTENFEHIAKYMQLNGIRIADAETVQAAFVRLREAGILVPNLAPTRAPAPAQKPKPAPPPVPEKPATPVPDGEMGFDPQSGLPRRYSAREVRAMSADEYRRAFKIVRADLEPTF